MSDPRDIDEDAILKGLSAEELDQLEYELQEMDPEVGGSPGLALTLQNCHLIGWILKSRSPQILQGFCFSGHIRSQ